MNYVISKEDLLVKIAKLKAENSLLRSKLVECGQDKSMILELEHKLKLRTDERVIELNKHITTLNERITKLNDKIYNQKKTLRQINGNQS